ncbi:MAG: hypothetical protein AAF291_16670 [Pseudomonadota bacterium]
MRRVKSSTSGVVRASLLGAAAISVSACNPIEVLFPEDPRLGDEPINICAARVRAKMTYEESQALENTPGRFVPSYLYDITLLDLEAIQDLIAKGADDTMGTRLIRANNDPTAAVEQFKRQQVDTKGALFLNRKPALYKVRGQAQPASTILESGCKRQLTNTRLREVTWTRAASNPAPEEKTETETETETVPEAEGDVIDVPNLGGVQ